MTLLLVDDQINVINGLMNGINYRKLKLILYFLPQVCRKPKH